MTTYINYRKKSTQPMRPVTEDDAGLYYHGGLSVSQEDEREFLGFLEGKNDGGMIAVNPDNPADKWYVNRSFFQKNYEEAGGDVDIEG